VFLVGLAELAGVSKSWLAFGEDDASAQLAPVNDDDQWRVPIYSLEVSAGGGNFPEDQKVVGHLGFPEPELRRLGQPNHLALATVKGSSMEPELRDSDLVMFDWSARDMRDGVVIFRNDDAVLLKRLHVVGRGKVELLSSSAAYNPINLQQGVDDFEVLGRVVGKFART
jgi:phage repressor protein C with HTH and peptisase S24 domain